MCFDHDSRPPIVPNPTGMLEAADLVLEAPDGNRFAAHLARAAEPTGAAIVILPDIRGLHAYYRELTERFAEHGVDAISIDYFGRTAGLTDRGPDFDHRPHVAQTTYAGLSADIRVAVDRLRAEVSPERLYTTGFCMGGRLSFLTATMDLGLAGVIGFYGWPVGKGLSDIPAPAEHAAEMTCPVLGIFGGADEGIPKSASDEFERALEAASVDHCLTVYEGAPHSFFDRKAADFVQQSDRAWAETLGFMGVAKPA
ncbi:MAG: dienelactone hydrolase family protein [Chloroflexota bacterium]